MRNEPKPERPASLRPLLQLSIPQICRPHPGCGFILRASSRRRGLIVLGQSCVVRTARWVPEGSVLWEMAVYRPALVKAAHKLVTGSHQPLPPPLTGKPFPHQVSNTTVPANT